MFVVDCFVVKYDIQLQTKTAKMAELNNNLQMINHTNYNNNNYFY